MKLYNTFLGTILLTALLALLVYNAGVGDQPEGFIPGHYVMAGVMAFSDDKMTTDQPEEAIEIAENAIKAESEVFYADEWIRSWFVRLDKDQDTFISRTEFQKNIEPFAVSKYQMDIFRKSKANPDGVLNLFEFHNFIDTTKLLSPKDYADKAAPVSANTDDVDPIKLLAGVLAISLLMAAFKFV